MLLEDHIPNFRDLGGLPAAAGACVSSGRLARSAAMLQGRATRVPELRERMPGATYFDLRTDAEVERHGAVTLPEGWTRRHRPIFDADLGHPIAPDRFDEVLRRHRPIVLEIAEAVTATPVVVACALGKDRTGFVVAALLHMLGVSHEAIVRDYALSNEQLARWPVAGTYHPVAPDHCLAWLGFLADNLDAPPATVAGLRRRLLRDASG